MILLQQIGAIRETSCSFYLRLGNGRFLFSNPLNTDETNTNLNNEPPNMEDEILHQATAWKEMIRKHNAAGGSLLKPIRLDFGDTEDEPDRIKPDERDDDLDKPYKEAFRSPFSRKIVQYTEKK